VAGVLEATVEHMRALGATDIEAVIGPCIRPGCYQFGAGDLDLVADRLGDAVRGQTTGGKTALDIPAAVKVALATAGIDGAAVADVGTCTACSSGHYSWRARRELQRQAAVIWR
jgi:copper oxidase (laccase) domain-containing protein